MSRKKAILFVLLGVFAITLVYRITHPYKQKKVSELTHTGGQSAGGTRKSPDNAAKQPEGPDEVLLGVFLKPPHHAEQVSKNIFFQEPAGRQTAQPVKPEEPGPSPNKPAGPPPENPVEMVNRELSLFRVFGFYESDGDKVLFLERGKEILVVRKGDRIDGKYLVKAIGKDSLTLRAEHIDEDVHIDLSDL